MVTRMMQYFYILDYSDKDNTSSATATTSATPLSVFEVNAQMYAMGDQFRVPGLKKVAAAKFDAHCWEAQGWNDIPGMQAILDSVQTVYTSTPEGDRTLRDSIASTVARYPTSRRTWLEAPESRGSVISSRTSCGMFWRRRWVQGHIQGMEVGTQTVAWAWTLRGHRSGRNES